MNITHLNEWKPCEEPECAGMGKCLRQEHIERRRLVRLEPAAIEAWKARQADAENFGGVCEYDHEGADALIEALLVKVEELELTAEVHDCGHDGD